MYYSKDNEYNTNSKENISSKRLRLVLKTNHQTVPINNNLTTIAKGECEMTDQEKAKKWLTKWLLESDDKVALLKGTTGTGTTELICKWAETLLSNSDDNINYPKFILFLTPTNEDKKDLKKRIKNKNIEVLTIDKGLDKKPFINENGDQIFTSSHRKLKDDLDINKADLIIVNQCSMVTKGEYNDLTKNTNGSKVIFVGDRHLLPPVNANESNVFNIQNSFNIDTVIKNKNAIQEECTRIKKEIDKTILNSENPTQYKIKCDSNTIISITEREAIEKIVELRRSKNSNYSQLLAYSNNTVKKCNNFTRSELFGTNKYLRNMYLVVNKKPLVRKQEERWTTVCEIADLIQITSDPVEVNDLTAEFENLKNLKNNTLAFNGIQKLKATKFEFWTEKGEKFKAIVLDKESEEIKKSIIIESLKKELQEEKKKAYKEEQKLSKLRERLDSFDYKRVEKQINRTEDKIALIAEKIQSIKESLHTIYSLGDSFKDVHSSTIHASQGRKYNTIFIHLNDIVNCICSHAKAKKVKEKLTRNFTEKIEKDNNLIKYLHLGPKESEDLSNKPVNTEKNRSKVDAVSRRINKYKQILEIIPNLDDDKLRKYFAVEIEEYRKNKKLIYVGDLRECLKFINSKDSKTPKPSNHRKDKNENTDFKTLYLNLLYTAVSSATDKIYVIDRD